VNHAVISVRRGFVKKVHKLASLRRRLFLFAETPSVADTQAVHLLEGGDVASGTVKWFNGQKGYGFIQPDTGGKDVFVHISAVEKAGIDGLPEGAKISYDIVPNKGKESAENLKLK
jgi:CspA family cold shock protein